MSWGKNEAMPNYTESTLTQNAIRRFAVLIAPTQHQLLLNSRVLIQGVCLNDAVSVRVESEITASTIW